MPRPTKDKKFEIKDQDAFAAAKKWGLFLEQPDDKKTTSIQELNIRINDFNKKVSEELKKLEQAPKSTQYSEQSPVKKQSLVQKLVEDFSNDHQLRAYYYGWIANPKLNLLTVNEEINLVLYFIYTKGQKDQKSREFSDHCCNVIFKMFKPTYDDVLKIFKQAIRYRNVKFAEKIWSAYCQKDNEEIIFKVNYIQNFLKNSEEQQALDLSILLKGYVSLTILKNLRENLVQLDQAYSNKVTKENIDYFRRALIYGNKEFIIVLWDKKKQDIITYYENLFKISSPDQIKQSLPKEIKDDFKTMIHAHLFSTIFIALLVELMPYCKKISCDLSEIINPKTSKNISKKNALLYAEYKKLLKILSQYESFAWKCFENSKKKQKDGEQSPIEYVKKIIEEIKNLQGLKIKLSKDQKKVFKAFLKKAQEEYPTDREIVAVITPYYEQHYLESFSDGLKKWKKACQEAKQKKENAVFILSIVELFNNISRDLCFRPIERFLSKEYKCGTQVKLTLDEEEAFKTFFENVEKKYPTDDEIVAVITPYCNQRYLKSSASDILEKWKTACKSAHEQNLTLDALAVAFSTTEKASWVAQPQSFLIDKLFEYISKDLCFRPIERMIWKQYWNNSSRWECPSAPVTPRIPTDKNPNAFFSAQQNTQKRFKKDANDKHNKHKKQKISMS